MMRHSSKHARGNVEGLSSDGCDTADNDDIEKVRESGNAGFVEGDDERGCVDTTAAEETVVGW